MTTEMACGSPSARVTICVLTYGNHAELASRVIQSIQRCCPRAAYLLVAGANAVADATRDYLAKQQGAGEIDHLIVSARNINKCPMMRRMFHEVTTEFIWWFDDDSYVTEPKALETWLAFAQASPSSTVMWGQRQSCAATLGFTYLNERATLAFVRAAPWYRGLPPPSWRPGGKGEFNYHGNGTGNGRWEFLVGGCWMIRTAAVRALDWPDPRLTKMGDDAFLGEAIRQQGWDIMDIGAPSVAINTEPRRGQAQ